MKPLVFLALLTVSTLCMTLCSCAFKMGADGSKEVTVDGQGVAMAAAVAGQVLKDK